MNKQNILKIFGALLLFLLLSSVSFKIFTSIKPEQAIKPISIVYVTDNNYVPYLRTSVRSIIANKNPKTEINIYVLGDNLKEINKEKIYREQKKNIKIKIIPISNEVLKSFEKRSKIVFYVSRADNIKFFIASTLSNINKVLYLDCDTVILKDLSNLYSLNLENNYIGAVKDLWTAYVGESEKDHFNNGVMLLDLDKIRKNKIEKKLIDYKKNDKVNRFVTQDAFNSVMYGHVMFLPIIYNVYAYEYDKKYDNPDRNIGFRKKNYAIGEKYLPKNKKDVIIIHYAGSYKKPGYKINFLKESNRIWYRYAPIDFWLDYKKVTIENDI